MAGRDLDDNELFGDEKEDSSEFEKMLNAETSVVSAKRHAKGSEVKGTIISKGSEFYFIDLGGKVAGCLPVDEFQKENTLPKVGDTVSAFVREDNGSEVILTKSLKRGDADDSMLRQAFENEQPIEGKVEKAIKGGFEVSVGTKRAFVPISQMDKGRITDESIYVGCVFKFHITELKSRNIVLSRRRIVEEEQDSLKQQILGTLEVGMQKEATITRLADFGAFADLGGVEALIPISELAWQRVKKVDEIVKVGDKVQTKVIKIEHTPRLRIALSLKDAGEDPWVSNATRFNPGDQMAGKVVRLADFGAFVEVLPGVEGLVHVSQITWEKRLKHPSEALKVGQELSAKVVSFDLENRKLSLSLKGDMPESLAKKLAAKSGSELSSEEAEMKNEWQSYQKQQVSLTAARSDGNAMADAFKRAKKR